MLVPDVDEAVNPLSTFYFVESFPRVVHVYSAYHVHVRPLGLEVNSSSRRGAGKSNRMHEISRRRPLAAGSIRPRTSRWTTTRWIFL